MAEEEEEAVESFSKVFDSSAGELVTCFAGCWHSSESGLLQTNSATLQSAAHWCGNSIKIDLMVLYLSC